MSFMGTHFEFLMLVTIQMIEMSVRISEGNLGLGTAKKKE